MRLGPLVAVGQPPPGAATGPGLRWRKSGGGSAVRYPLGAAGAGGLPPGAGASRGTGREGGRARPLGAGGSGTSRGCHRGAPCRPPGSCSRAEPCLRSRGFSLFSLRVFLGACCGGLGIPRRHWLAEQGRTVLVTLLGVLVLVGNLLLVINHESCPSQRTLTTLLHQERLLLISNQV